ncbi:MAG TPA: hypothetical protein VFT98_05430 [Myxococcota bacterium]|nr:hypothetical protein [Myxococcota bacterium]
MSAGLAADARVSTLEALLLMLFFGLFFYQWGAANLEGFLNYPLFRDMGEKLGRDDYLALRAGITRRIVPLLVAPFALSIVCTLALTLRGSQLVPRALLLAILALQAVIAISTLTIQAPIQLRLNREGHDLAVATRLIVTDFWLRKVPVQIEGGLVLYALWRVISR